MSMKIGYTPLKQNIAFKSKASDQRLIELMVKKEVASAKSLETQPEQAPKQKVGVFQRMRNFTGGVKKFFMKAGEYAKAIVKSVFYGALVAVPTYLTLKAVDAVKQFKAQKAGETFKKMPKAAKIAIATLAAAIPVTNVIYNTGKTIHHKNANIDRDHRGLESK